MPRKRRSDKKTRYKRCKRKKAMYQGVKVVLPCRATKLTAPLRARLDDEYTEGRWAKCKRLAATTKGSCRVVFFTARQPVMRMSNRKLSSPTKKATRKRMAKKQCRHPSNSGPKAKRGRFKRC